MNQIKWEEEYSEKFDILRKNRVHMSFYKYGSAKINFGKKYVNALGCLKRCIDKYQKTKNTAYLCDAANYIMFEFMYPSIENAKFVETDSSGSAGIDGISINEIKSFREDIYG